MFLLMKKAIAKNGLRMMTFGLLLLGAFLFSSNRADAQTQIGGYNWKQIDQAIPAIVDAMIPVKEAAATLPAGPARDNAQAHLLYYAAIHQALSNGVSVETAVFTSLNIFGDGQGMPAQDADDIYLPPANKQVLFQDAVSVLTQ
jgi:hypothetical protein